ncbi:hypothetical protein R4172_15280 [Rhodococcus kroppenstedtii]|uniref:hypothetical protein n=1 Tax=Rhodococcoides kroppenstedtii TaxID=293050 RepID=UPI0028EA902B|nr:hypothetical protein [Rhodococcus kroppenstedtii]MDV7198912.1 hypothetical protein [Rhodococcus kroppenstedtii]
MSHSPFGLFGRPAGDPGFTVAIEIGTDLYDLELEQQCRILELTGRPGADFDQSATGCARVVYELPHTGWVQAGTDALDVLQAVLGEFEVFGAEICRSDLWAEEPIFPTMPSEVSTGRPPDQDLTVVTVELDSSVRRSTADLGRALLELRAVGGAHCTPAPEDRHHLILTMPNRSSLVSASAVAGKCLIPVGHMWQINRVRVVESQTYHLELEDRARYHPPRVPDWQFALGGEDGRMVVVPDGSANLHGWTVASRQSDGQEHTAELTRDLVWIDEAGLVNLLGHGDRIEAWTATLPGSALLTSFATPQGTEFLVDRWDGMTNWLVETLVRNGSGLIVDLGPGGYVAPVDEDVDDDDLGLADVLDPDDEVINAQLHVLDDGVVMVRRSRTVLRRLRLGDHSVEGLELDVWHHDGHFDDCTDGYLFTSDLHLAASACTAWFRDHGGLEALDALGCDYSFADALPATDREDA